MRKSEIMISNFIVFLVLLLGTIFIGFCSELIDNLNGIKNNGLLNLFQIGIFGSIFSFFTYGIIIWPSIIIMNIFIELFCLKKFNKINNIKNSFLIEKVIVSVLAAYLSLTYQYYYWLLLIPIFLIAEYLRIIYLKKWL